MIAEKKDMKTTIQVYLMYMQQMKSSLLVLTFCYCSCVFSSLPYFYTCTCTLLGQFLFEMNFCGMFHPHCFGPFAI